MRKFILAALFGVLFTQPTLAQWASGANCPAGYIDTLGWIGPNPTIQQANGYWAHKNHNTDVSGGAFMGELWSAKGGASGVEYIIKQADGRAWDDNVWDSNYWYYYTTTEDTWWGDPSKVKVFNPPVPAMKRCEPAGTAGSPTKLDSLTSYNNNVYSTQGGLPPYGNNSFGCVSSPTNVGTITMETWGPYSYYIGSETTPMTTYVLAYYYNWNGYYYTHRELEFFQQPGKGWVQWEHDVWTGSGWQMDNMSEFAETVTGSPTTIANPCGY